MNDNESNSREFLDFFFGDRNELKLNDIKSGAGAAGAIRPWIERLDCNPRQPTVIPYKFKDPIGNTHYYWYATAQSGRELRDLSEKLMAFIGPTWSSLRGELSNLDLTNSLDLAISNFTGGLAFKFTGDNQKIWQRLELMRQVLWETKKVKLIEDIRPAGRVLRDFNIALQVQNRESAENSLFVLQHQHGYDAINISFLRVQMLAEFDQWSELLEMTTIADIMLVRRPVAVTQTLIKAVYREELQRFEEVGDAKGAMQHFRREIFPRFGGLFSTRSGISAPEAIKSFMLLAVGAETPKLNLRDELLKLENLSDSDTKYVKQIANLIVNTVQIKESEVIIPVDPKPVGNDLLQIAKEKMWSGDFDNAFQLAIDSPPSITRTQILLSCAYEIQTLEVERTAINAFNELDNKDQNALITVRATQTLIVQITGTTLPSLTQSKYILEKSSEVIPTNWTAWLDRLYGEPNWVRALDIARKGANEWKIEETVEKQTEIDKLANKLVTFPNEAENTLYEALPYLLEFFIRQDEQFPRRECTKIYFALFDILTISTNGGDDDLTLFNELTFALLSLGIQQKDYAEILINADDLWQRFASPSKVNWILDYLDSLIIYPCLDETKRGQLLAYVVSSLTPFARRIKPDQWNFFSMLVGDLKINSIQPIIEQYRELVEIQVVSSPNLLSYLNGKTISIYTLTERVAQRVKSLIQLECQNVTVNLSHEKVGSERLRHWARNSDIFVMVTGSAKHAATEFIEANRESLPILRPLGKGSASIFNALHQFIADTYLNGQTVD